MTSPAQPSPKGQLRVQDLRMIRVLDEVRSYLHLAEIVSTGEARKHIGAAIDVTRAAERKIRERRGQ